MLITQTDQKERQLIDGVRVFEDPGWVLVAPNRLTAAFNIIAESPSAEQTNRLLAKYRELVEQSQEM